MIMDMTKCTVTTSRPFEQKEKLRCMFCRGVNCNRCGETAYLSLTSPAIAKLHSTWVDDSILAMQRPSDTLMRDSNLIEQFVSNRIVAVFNLTEPGEHPYCGGGNLKESGFPYYPEKLMAAGIKHFNYAWPDMTAPSINLMKDIVRVACSEIVLGGKIAVHCHAGYGRTGIAIASIMIALRGMTGLEVITQIRARRPGSIQTAKQKQFVYEFEKSHWQAMQIFPPCESDGGPFERQEDAELEEAMTVSAAETFSRTMLDFSISPTKSPRPYKSALSDKPPSIDTSLESVKAKCQSQLNILNSDALNAKNKDMTPRSTKDSNTPRSAKDLNTPRSTKDMNTPRSATSEMCGSAMKSIAQSLRDQQYSLPVDELFYGSRVPMGTGDMYEKNTCSQNSDLIWNHKCVVVCSRALKELCLTPSIAFECRSSPLRDKPPDIESSVCVVQSKSSSHDLSLICTSMTGLFFNPTGCLDAVRRQTKRTVLDLLNSSFREGGDSDVISEEEFMEKNRELTVTRLETFKLEMNKGTWDRLDSTIKTLLDKEDDPEGDVSLADQMKRLCDDFNAVEKVEDYTKILSPFPAVMEKLSRRECLAAVSQLLLDFLDTRSNCVFDESLTAELLKIWSGENTDIARDLGILRLAADCAQLDNECASLLTAESSETSQMCQGSEEVDQCDDLMGKINKTLETFKLERAKLTLLQQVVDLLQKFYTVVTSTCPTQECDDKETADGDSSFALAREIQRQCYILICFRIAVSCTMSLRNREKVYSQDSVSGRCSEELSLSFAKLVLKNFKIDDTTEFPSTLRGSLIFVGDIANPSDIDNIISPPNILGQCNSGVVEDVRVVLCVMSTLHLLAVRSWNHHGILPNRLRLNRRLC